MYKGVDDVRVGEVVVRGTQIGALANRAKAPGLRFEVREATGIDLPENGGANQVDPLVFLQDHHAQSRWPDALTQRDLDQEEGMENLQLDAESAQKLGEILSK